MYTLRVIILQKIMKINIFESNGVPYMVDPSLKIMVLLFFSPAPQSNNAVSIFQITAEYFLLSWKIPELTIYLFP